MSRKPPKSPQEKKSLSYAKDRRNAYGANDKASRRLIPLLKARQTRKERHNANQEISVLPRLDEGAAALVESSARQATHGVGGWTKCADDPLGTIVGRALEARQSRAGRKARSRGKPS